MFINEADAQLLVHRLLREIEFLLEPLTTELREFAMRKTFVRSWWFQILFFFFLRAFRRRFSSVPLLGGQHALLTISSPARNLKLVSLPIT